MKQKDIIEAHRFHRFTQIFRPLCILRLTSPTMHPAPSPYTLHLTPLNHSTTALRFPGTHLDFGAELTGGNFCQAR